MKIKIDEVKDTVSRVESDRSAYAYLARKWEKMWCLDLFEKSRDKAAEEDGQEQVTLPTPYNVVNLAERLITTTPDIICPSPAANNVDDGDAALRQKWLKAMWQRANKQARKDIIGAAWWQSLVRGRGVFEIKWVEDALPKRLKERRMPIHIRTLDPLNCGFVHGELFTEVGFHKYYQERRLAAHRYPAIKRKLYDKRNHETGKPTDTDDVEIVDYWYVSFEDGSVWNCIMVDGHFAKPPAKTDYVDIPLVEFLGDDAPSSKEEHKSLSVLHPIKDLWEYESVLASQIATGVLWYFWPHISIQNEYGAEIPNRPIRPGETQQYPFGTKIEMHQMQPNVPMAERMLALVDGAVQQGTFPGVMYGQEPGSLQAGYGVSLLSDAAKGRVNKPRRNLERSMELVNEIALALVEEMAGDKGVGIWGDSPEMGGIYSCHLYPENISGYYDNQVTISPNVPMEELQKATLGLRMVDNFTISRDTYRKKFLKEVMPEDEQRRVELERAFQDPEYRPYVNYRTLNDYFGPDWDMTRKQWMDNFVMEQAQRQQMVQQMMQPPQPPMPPQGGPPMAPPDMGVTPQSPAMMEGMAPPIMEGQLTPEAMGVMPGDLPPELFQALVDEGLAPADEAEQMMRSASGMAGQ
jgi:hypothetical protein